MFDKPFMAERLWTLEELVERLHVKRSWVYDQTSRFKIPFRKIGGKLRFDPNEIDVWIESQPGWSLKNSRDSAPSKKEGQNEKT